MKCTDFNKGWRFIGCDKDEIVTVPHDFMIGTQRTPDSQTGADYGYFQPCKGTYIKSLEKSDTATRQFIKFDGVMGVTEVYVNDELVKFHPYGYTAFICDVSDKLHDGENELRVEVDATSQSASRWYTGAGIYRDVELLSSNDDYIVPFSVFVKTLEINESYARIGVEACIFAKTAGEAKVTISFPENSHSIRFGTWLNEGENHISQKTLLRGAEKWDVNNPKLYSCEVSLKTETSCDSETVSFGVRTIMCDPERGLLLNGEPVKLYGTCNHHDNGIVGAASYRSAEERRVRILKENGFNAIRCAHNPPSTMLLDVCDRMGMLVIDEIFDCWGIGKRAYDYHLWFKEYAKEDISSMVKRDRNHPSVIMWSTGNEIFERFGKHDGYRTGRMIADTIRESDDTRLLTHAFCYYWDNSDLAELMVATDDYPAEKLDYWCEKIYPQAGNLEVLGYNYYANRIAKDSVRFPEHLLAVTESYPVDAVWVKREMDAQTKFIGEFVWTGWDYFGETGIGRVIYGTDSAPGWGLTAYPEHISNCGDFDICGFKKPQSYYRDAAWYKGSVHILTADPDNFGKVYAFSRWGFYDVNRTWTYSGREGKMTTVHLYTTANECELLQDGVSLGKKTPDDNGIAIFEVEYKPGKLEALSYENGLIIGKDELYTVGAPTSIAIKPDVTGDSGKADLIYAEITLCDENGNASWEANDEVTVTVLGGKVLGTGSGKIDDVHDYTQNVCCAYHGKLLAAILPESDTVTITASTDKMSASVEVKA